MWAMNKAIGITMLAFLSCLSMTIAFSESVQARTTEQRAAEADWRYNLVIRAIRDSQYQKAIDFALMSLDICREIKGRECEARAYNGLGLGYFYLGQYDKVIDSYQQRLAIARGIKDRHGEGITLANMGSTYLFLGRYDKAIEFYLQSLAIDRETKDRLGEAKSLGNLGSAYESLGKYDKAIEFHRQALAIFRERKDVSVMNYSRRKEVAKKV